MELTLTKLVSDTIAAGSPSKKDLRAIWKMTRDGEGHFLHELDLAQDAVVRSNDKGETMVNLGAKGPISGLLNLDAGVDATSGREVQTSANNYIRIKVRYWGTVNESDDAAEETQS